ncbi:GNAT family N-acetyltransferase [Acidovorax sp. LjRoot117]|uniref:GNAT family N-acetyltransferase n=1 Tax=Acidovorax sp. LjRoot117 TaxID=3342255 RepID=UPI003ECD6E2C
MTPGARPAVFVRPPVMADAPSFIALACQSRALHAPWTTAPCDAKAFSDFLATMDSRNNHSFLVCLRSADGAEAMAGVINITQIVMGAFCSGYLGYYAFAGHERQGRMRAGLLQVLLHAVGVLKLHRLEANIQPGNLRSIALVRSCGFVQEGFSPRYLKIDGHWRDHERWAVLAD